MKKLLFLTLTMGFANFAMANETELKKETGEKAVEEAPVQTCCWRAAADYLDGLHRLMTQEEAEAIYNAYFTGCVRGGGSSSSNC